MNKDTNQIMALINAYKMDGLGNDFIIIDRRQKSIEITTDKIINLANKKKISFDQLITLEKGPGVNIRIFNPDGVEVNACGNGARCVAYLIYSLNKKHFKEIPREQILGKTSIWMPLQGPEIPIETKERILRAKIVGEKKVNINMGHLKYKDWKDIPLSKKMNTLKVNIDFMNKQYGDGICVNVGNPHIIFFVKDCSKIDIKKLGPKIENHKYFPERVNVTFAQVLDRNNIKVNVWERGAGQTKACGTAACATAFAAYMKGLVHDAPNIIFKEGSLEIEIILEQWNLSEYDLVFMTGPVSEVKKISLDI